MKLLIWVIIAIVLLVAAFGLVQWVRRQIAQSRKDLKHVDRSKLRDLDEDAWGREERDEDDWNS